MKLKKYLNLFILLAIFAIALSMVTVKAYTKEKKPAAIVYKLFTDVKGSSGYYYNGEADCYTDSKNNKLYIDVDDFFNSLMGTAKESQVKADAGKKSVVVKTGKKYKEKYANGKGIEFPKSVKGKPENIKFNIDGKNISIKGYVVTVKVQEVSFNLYWQEVWKEYTEKVMLVDFDELAKKLDLISDKNMSKRKYLLCTKLPDGIVELKTGKKPIESYDFNNDTSVEEISGYDIDVTWSSPIKNYLYEENGDLVRIECKEGDEKNKKSKKSKANKVIVNRYDKTGNLISTKTLDYQGEKFGGFYRGEDYNYLIFGNDNREHKDNKEVVRIVKYDRDFIEIAKLSVNGAYTWEPFGAGSLRCGEIGNIILVHTARGRYDGHQSSLTIAFDEDDMSLLNADDLGAFQRDHVSHSFNQFVMPEGNEFIVIDHGDAYPRSILANWLITEPLIPNFDYIDWWELEQADEGKYSYFKRFLSSKKKEILDIPGGGGANQTGVSIGSAANMANKVLVGVNRMDYSKAKSFNSYIIEGKDVYKRDIVLYSLDKNTLEVTENKYTDYTKDKNTTYTAPKMVKLDDTRVMLIWNKLNMTWKKLNDQIIIKNLKTSVLQYLIVDENGNKLSEIKTVKDMIVTDEAPILFDNKVVWSQYSGGRLVLNQIPLK